MESIRKVAVVTGGTKGIGRAVVLGLVRRGYFVYTNYAHDELAAKELRNELGDLSEQVAIVKADQSDKKDFADFVAFIHRNESAIHCIVCNSGITVRKSMSQLDDDDWEKTMRVSVYSHFYLIQHLYSFIQPDSRIVFIGSMLGIQPHATSLPYGVSKAAVHMLAKSLVKEFEGTGTTVNAIAPGFVETEWQKNKPKEIRENIYRKTACKRFASSQEVESAVLFCLDNAFLNGAIIEVNGGYSYR